MTEGGKRGVTRAYVRGVMLAALVVAAALVLAAWGLIGLALDREPVETPDVPTWFGVVAVVAALVMLGALLWQQALSLLRGRKSPVGSLVVGAAFGVYLLWGLAGIAFGLSVSETFLSPFALALAIIWPLTVVLFWAVLARRVYTDRPTPQWPWERTEKGE